MEAVRRRGSKVVVLGAWREGIHGCVSHVGPSVVVEASKWHHFSSIGHHRRVAVGAGAHEWLSTIGEWHAWGRSNAARVGRRRRRCLGVVKCSEVYTAIAGMSLVNVWMATVHRRSGSALHIVIRGHHRRPIAGLKRWRHLVSRGRNGRRRSRLRSVDILRVGCGMNS